MWKKIIYSPISLFIWLHAILPLRVLYLLSDILFLLTFYVVRYRRKMVYKNLSSSFPNKSKKEIRELEHRFYHHFCDYIVETIKLVHISDSEMKQRMRFENLELLQGLVAEGKSCIVYLGHYGNWEWIPSINLWLERGSVDFAQIYRPLKNEWFNQFFLRLRSRFHTRCIAKPNTLRVMLRAKNSPVPMVTGFIADQSPALASIHLWTRFLEHNTPMLSGAAVIAKRLDQPVLFLDVQKVKRGHYTARLLPIALNPQECTADEIIESYARNMERTILRAPQYWLWSHNRWKHEHLYNSYLLESSKKRESKK